MRTQRKFLAWMMTFFLLASVVPTAALAVEPEDGEPIDIMEIDLEEPMDASAMSGNCGASENDNVTWLLTQNNDDSENPTYTLTISGSGAMADFDRLNSVNKGEQGNTPWYRTEKQQYIAAVVLDEGITAIGANAFRGCSSISSVCVLPSTLISIGSAAFSGCTSMRGDLSLPANLRQGRHELVRCQQHRGRHHPGDAEPRRHRHPRPVRGHPPALCGKYDGINIACRRSAPADTLPAVCSYTKSGERPACKGPGALFLPAGG